MSLRTWLVAGSIWLSCAQLAAAASTPTPMPPGIDIRLTLAGPVFVDPQGMTLYRVDKGDTLGLDTFACPDHPLTRIELALLGYNQITEVPMNVFDPATRRACTEKFPPFAAPAAAKPIGDWSVHTRANGVRQWAYRGAPLQTSIKDTLPGHVNGGGVFTPAMAPLHAPPNIELRVTTVGLVWSNHLGKTLYYQDGAKDVARQEWQPLLAPVAASTTRLSSEWSIVKGSSGLRQWAWQGKPLFTYVNDTENRQRQGEPAGGLVDIVGEKYGQPPTGWRVALLKPAPGHPAEVRIVSHPPDRAGTRGYADRDGAALYVMNCGESTADLLDCDDVGDSPRYWLSFCGGEERCSRSWRPLMAPAGAKPVDDVWSVMVLNPHHPFKRLQAGEQGISVWAWRGRPVFTHTRYRQPGDYSAFAGRAGSMMGSSPIVAYAGE